MTDQTLQNFAQQLGEQLVAQKLLLATAESCTGGWVSKVITDIDGSSRWFDCALVTYSNQSKQDLLGVSAGRQPELYWYPRSVASGVYFCSLIAGSAKEAVKFVVVR